MQSQLSDAKANEAQASKLLDDVEKKVAELQATNKKLERQAVRQRILRKLNGRAESEICELKLAVVLWLWLGRVSRGRRRSS